MSCVCILLWAEFFSCSSQFPPWTERKGRGKQLTAFFVVVFPLDFCEICGDQSLATNKMFLFLFAKAYGNCRKSIWPFLGKHIGEWTNYSSANVLDVWLDHYYYHTCWRANPSTRLPACEWCVAAPRETQAGSDACWNSIVIHLQHAWLPRHVLDQARVYGSISILSVDWAQSSTCSWLQVMVMVTIFLSKALDCGPNNTWASCKQARQPLVFLCCSIRSFHVSWSY